MKTGILIAILISSVTVNAQSLKELLYSGKLKNDSNTVIRKGDDLSTKIDTNKKKPVVTEKTKTAVTPAGDSLKTGVAVSSTDSAVATGDPTAPAAAPGNNNTSPADNSTSVNTAPKDNNKIWKEYIDSLAGTLKTEVLTNKKIKSGTYYVFVEYEISTEGQVTINNVSPSPESSFLADQIKERLTLTAPQLNPTIYNGKPRKTVKKFTFTLTKD